MPARGTLLRVPISRFCLAQARLHLLLISVISVQFAFSQAIASSPQPPSSKASKESERPDLLEQHYQSARTFSVGGDFARAASEYRMFLAEVIRRMANVDSKEGRLETSSALFQEAMSLEPKSPELPLDYGNALLLHGDFSGAKAQAEKAVEL